MSVSRTAWLQLLILLFAVHVGAASAPQRAEHAMVVTQSQIASRVGVEVLKQGGNAIDAAVATAFALAVTYPEAGNIGGGGFMVYQPHDAQADTYDFRETAPTGSHPEMWLDENGEYQFRRQYVGPIAAGVPGTVAGLHLAWKDHGSLPSKRLTVEIDRHSAHNPLRHSSRSHIHVREIDLAVEKMCPAAWATSHATKCHLQHRLLA